jgi:hypothetical protein
MKANLSDIIKLVNPSKPSGGQGGSGSGGGIQTQTVEEPQDQETQDGEGDQSQQSPQAPNDSKPGAGQGEGGEGSEGPMVGTDSIDNIEKKTVVVRNDVPKGKSGGQVVRRGTGEVISPEQGKRIAEAEGYDEKSQAGEEDWKKKSRDAAQRHLTPRTRTSGKGTGEIYQRIMELTDPIVDWRQELKKFIGKLASSSDFKFPARRSIASGDYKYALKNQNNALEKGVVAIDVSGSIASAFPDLLAEVVGIASAKKVKEISVLPWNDRVGEPVIFKNFKKPQPSDFENVKTGGGSTGIPDIVRWIKDRLKDKPEFVVIMTDGYIPTLPDAPKWGKKTIWLVFDNSSFDPPIGWGRVIHAKGDPRYFG